MAQLLEKHIRRAWSVLESSRLNQGTESGLPQEGSLPGPVPGLGTGAALHKAASALRRRRSPALAGTAGIDVEHQGSGHLVQLAMAEPGGERRVSLAAEPGRAAVVGERQQRGLLVDAELGPAGHQLPEQAPIALQPPGKQGIG